MASIFFQVGVLVLGAVTTVESLHNHINDWAGKRRARKEGKRSRRNSSRDRGERRANTLPDSFERDFRQCSDEQFRRSDELRSTNFERKPSSSPLFQTGQLNTPLTQHRPRHSSEYAASSANGPSSSLDALSREAKRKHLDEQRKRSYGAGDLEKVERERRRDPLAPMSQGRRSSYVGMPPAPTPPNGYQHPPTAPGVVRNASNREPQYRDHFESKSESGSLAFPDSPFSAQRRQSLSRSGDNLGFHQNTGFDPGRAAPVSPLSTNRPIERRSSTERPRSYISPEYRPSANKPSTQGYTASNRTPATSQPPAYTSYKQRSTGYASSDSGSSISSGSSRSR